MLLVAAPARNTRSLWAFASGFRTAWAWTEEPPIRSGRLNTIATTIAMRLPDFWHSIGSVPHELTKWS